jgi:hypothetical protein
MMRTEGSLGDADGAFEKAAGIGGQTEIDENFAEAGQVVSDLGVVGAVHGFVDVERSLQQRPGFGGPPDLPGDGLEDRRRRDRRSHPAPHSRADVQYSLNVIDDRGSREHLAEADQNNRSRCHRPGHRGRAGPGNLIRQIDTPLTAA